MNINKKYILSLDQGTTSSRAIVFDQKGTVISQAQKQYPQIFPKPGWVEHDPMEIWKSQFEVARGAIKKAGISSENIAAIGITNQRETTILWDRKTGKPVYNAIVWQCRRTADICEKLKKNGHDETFRKKTGLALDAYFSGTKIKWLLDNIKGLRKKAENGEICFGTVDSWLLFNLTGQHATEPSNASRTLIYNINSGKWDRELLKILEIPKSILPEIKTTSGHFGNTKKKLFGKEIPVTALIGDQQAALFGQGCFTPGTAKCTYGTGCFFLINTGKKPVVSENMLLTTVAWDIGKGLEYALEGSVFICGAVIQWLKEELKILKNPPESEKMANSIPDTGGVYFVPAFVGLGTPYWDPEARGTILGITRGTTQEHIVRSALESIAFQCRDLIDAVHEDCGKRISELKVDGGVSVNSFLMQFQAEVIGLPVVQSAIAETTALGAAYLAGLACGYWKNQQQIIDNWQEKTRFKPTIKPYIRKKLLSNWKKAVEVSRQFKTI